MPRPRTASSLSVAALPPLPFLLAAGLVALGWLAMVDMLRASLLSMDAADLGPGMAAVGAFFLHMDGIPLELWQAICRTNVPVAFSWEAWAQVCGMATLMTLTMMLPCATPAWTMLRTGGSAVSALGFLGGYGSLWTVFSILLASIDLQLHLAFGAHLVSTSGTTGVLAACLVIAAGIFQWTAAKHRQRSRIALRVIPDCAPDAGLAASFAAGLRYGRCCLRSNALMMTMMIVLGMMNIVAMGLLLGAMLLEKGVETKQVSHGIGLALVLAGCAWIYAAAAA